MAEGQTTTGDSLEPTYTLWRGESWYKARLSVFLRTQIVHNQDAVLSVFDTSLYDSQDWDFLIPDSECMSLAWKWPPFNLCHLFSLWTLLLTTKQKVSEQISVMLKLLPASSSLLFCICQKWEAGWEAGHEWCSPGLGSLQLSHSHCFSSHYNGYLWLQHLVQLTA